MGMKVPTLFLLLIFPFLNAEEYPIQRLHFQEINSTQSFAKEHASEYLDMFGQWIVITADCQTNGTGHKGRIWESSSNGNIYATFVTLYPKCRDSDLIHVIQVSALAVVKTLQDCGLQPEIKWLNDILLGGRKVSGCLCEIIESPQENYYYLLIGIGLNVNMTLEELAFVPTPATSIYAETLETMDKEAVLSRLSTHVQDLLSGLLFQGFIAYYQDFDNLLSYKGKFVEIAIRSNTFVKGKVIGVSEDGSLMIEVSPGEILKISPETIIKVVNDESERS